MDLDRIKVIITDTTDFDIMKAITALKVPYPKADKINSLVNLVDLEELAARLGVMEMEGYIKTKTEADMAGDSLPQRYISSRVDQSRQAGIIRAKMVDFILFYNFFICKRTCRK